MASNPPAAPSTLASDANRSATALALTLADRAREEHQLANHVATLAREVVLKCVITIAERKYVKVEGWTAIASLYGYVASIHSVDVIPGEGVRAIAELVRLSDAVAISKAEGFVGEDEPDWFGGTVTRFVRRDNREKTWTVEPRPMHAIRAMAQTRAISRVLRGPFSAIIVMIDQNLSTTPYEEIMKPGDEPDPDGTGAEKKEEREPTTMKDALRGATTPPGPATGGGTGDRKDAPAGGPPASGPIEVPRDEILALRDQFRGGKWEAVVIHFGQSSKGKRLDELTEKALSWWIRDWQPKGYGNKPPTEDDKLLRAALDVADEELAAKKGGEKR